METVKLTINGQEVAAPKGELLIEACEMNGIYLPRFCHFRGLTPQASCRMCVVRVDNPKIPKLQTACTMPVRESCVVSTVTVCGAAPPCQVMSSVLVSAAGS